MVKRLLATGVSGFVGAPCLQAFLAGGFNEIHAVSRTGTGIASPAVRWHATDLRDGAAAARLVRDLRPTHLFHAAWVATPGVYLDSPENRDWKQATISMVRAFAEHGGQRFLGIGTSAEYAPVEMPCHEDTTALSPASLYGATKVDTWRSIRAIADERGMQAAWGRLFIPYGPGGPPQRLIPAAIARIRAGEAVPLARGEPQHDFVSTWDAARMLAGLMSARAEGAFNIGSGEPRSVRSIVEALADRLNLRDSLCFTELPAREWEPQFLVADMRKMAGLGLFVHTPMAEALDDLIP